jgi:hypothetical protein
MKYGGDWVLESTGQDIESVYFTESIEYYQYLLDTVINNFPNIYINGINITSIYQPYKGYQKAIATNIFVNGTDLCNLFEPNYLNIYSTPLNTQLYGKDLSTYFLPYNPYNASIPNSPINISSQTQYATSSSVTLSFTAPSTIGTITGYNIYLNGQLASGSGTPSSYTITGLTPNIPYSINISALVSLPVTTTTTTTTTFLPTTIPNCQLWFDASDNATVISSANKVSQWNDKSGNGYSVVQPTSGNQPTYTTNLLNSRPGIVLSSTAWLYQYGNNIPNFSNSSATTVFMVARNDSSLPTSGWSFLNTMWFTNSGSSGLFRYHLSFANANTTGVTSVNNNLTTINQSSAVAAGANAIVGLSWSTTSGLIYVNGTTATFAGETLINANQTSSGTGYSVLQTNTFAYTGANQTIAVPTGTAFVTAQLWGAGGGGAGNGSTGQFSGNGGYLNDILGSGGGGGYTSANLVVTAGTTLTIIVGQAGTVSAAGGQTTNTYGGGGGCANLNGDTNWRNTSGGGRSAIQISAADIITAGGGGGGGHLTRQTYTVPTTTYLIGGAGGGSIGGTGGQGDGAGQTWDGVGGTQSGGGAAGSVTTGGTSATAGTQYQGGTGNQYSAGGGGGYYGGGGGQYYQPNVQYFGAGGGGSSYVSSTYLQPSTTATLTQASGSSVAANSSLPAGVQGTIGGGGLGSASGATGQNGYVVLTFYSSTSTNTTTVFNIGDARGGYVRDIAVYEMLGFSSQLTTTQQQQIEGYLAWKWGLQTSLPVSHPYYSAAPVITSTSSATTYSNVNSILSTALSVTTTINPPTITGYTSTINSITVNFTAPSGTITGYTASAGAGLFTVSGASTSVTITGLSSNTSYSITLYATVGSVNSANATTTALTIPDASTIVIGTTSSTTSSITVPFTSSVPGAQALTYTASAVPTAGGSTTSVSGTSPITISSLTNGTSYTVTVSVSNSQGSSTNSPTTTVSTTSTTAILYYTFDTADVTGTTLLNRANGQYDLTLSTSTAISSTNPLIGTGSLQVLTDGTKYATYNTNIVLPTAAANNGYSVSFWINVLSGASGGSGGLNSFMGWVTSNETALSGLATDFHIQISNSDVSIISTYFCYAGTASNSNNYLPNWTNPGGTNYDNVWHHFCFVFKYTSSTAGTATLYRDNVAISTQTISSGCAQFTIKKLQIGHRTDGRDNWFGGNIDQFLFYTTPLNTTQVGQLYNKQIV